MPTRLQISLLPWLLVIAPAFAAPFPAEPTENQLEALRPGLSLDQVRQMLGPPQRIARQILYHRHLEQWLYDKPHLLRLEFDCPRGREGRLTTIQRSPKRQ